MLVFYRAHSSPRVLSTRPGTPGLEGLSLAASKPRGFKDSCLRLGPTAALTRSLALVPRYQGLEDSSLAASKPRRFEDSDLLLGPPATLIRPSH